MTQPTQTKVCIIGAGVSGLKTAQTLLKSSKFSVEDIIIVEAQDYIGGRVFTDKTSSKLGYTYDIGGAWFHDSLTNVVLNEAIKDNNPEEFDFHKDGYYDDMEYRYFHGDKEVPYLDGKLNRVHDELNKFIEIYYYESLDRPDMTLLEITDIYIKQYGYRLTEQQHKYIKQLIRFYELWFGISSDKISAKYAVMSHHGRDLYNKKGMSFLLEKLLKDIPKSQIWLKQQVNSINRNIIEGKMQVTTQKSTIHCDYIVVTVPLSILSLPETDPYGIKWEPPLPQSITQAIGNIHFGALGKVILEFDNVWWDKSIDRFVLLPEDFNTHNLSEPMTKLPIKSRYPILAVNYEAVHADDPPKQGGSLVLLTQSPLTDYVEQHPEQAWTYFKPMFTAMAKSPITDPINVITTKWTTNPFIRGSYTAVNPGDEPEDIIVQLSGEIEGTGISNSCVRFAGEHTISEGDGCIHGAYMSGEREANWILNRVLTGSNLKSVL